MGKSSKEIALEVLQQNDIGVLATNHNGRPNSRFMTFQFDSSKLYTIAESDSTVVQELADKPNVHIVIGYESESIFKTFLEIEGHAAFTENEKVKKLLLEKYPASTTEEWKLIEITLVKIRIMNKNGKNKEEVSIT